MTQSVAQVATAKASSNWFVKSLGGFAKSVVFKQFEKLRHGQLEVQEGDQVHYFGDSEDGLNARIEVRSERFYTALVTGGSIGAGESYMNGDWYSPDLTAVVRLLVRNMSLLKQLDGGAALLTKPLLRVLHKLNDNSERGAKRNIAAHYDIGNELFELFLDSRMMYSSAVFERDDSTLEQASEHKLALICEQLSLTANDHLLEIGTGWGGLAIYAASNYGCRVTTTTISERQYQLAKQRISDCGLEDRITLLKQDYRQLSGQFDKLVSVEMIEAVGWRYYKTFFQCCERLLVPGGRAVIQAITIPGQRYHKARNGLDFIQQYIFPGSCIPSLQALLEAADDATTLQLLEQCDYGLDYAKTLLCWNDNFQDSLDLVRAQGYSEEFINMWTFYLCYCAGGFAERAIGLSQLRFIKPEY